MPKMTNPHQPTMIGARLPFTSVSPVQPRRSMYLASVGLVLALAACGESTEPSLLAAPEASAAESKTEGTEELITPAVSSELEAPLFTSDVEGPGVRALESTFDFGTVYAGTQLNHTFQIEAVGTENLVINRIKPSCGCTIASTDVIESGGLRRPYVLKEALPPGTLLEVHCQFDTSGKRGPQVRPVNVYCNDPRGVQRLNLKADLDEFLVATPTTLRLGRFSIIESRSAKLVMRTANGEPIKLNADENRMADELSVRLEPQDPDGAGRAASWIVEVTLGGPTLLAGPYQYLLTIDSDVPNPSVLEDARPDQQWLGGGILIQADVLDVYSYSPSQLIYGQVRPDTAVSRGFAFNAFDEDYPLEELDTEVVAKDGKELAQLEQFHTRVEPGNVPGTWRVELMIDGLPATTGMFEGLVRINTKNPDRPHIDIPFAGVVR